MSKPKLSQTIQISGNVEVFLAEFAQAIRDGYEVVPSFYSPNCTPYGLLMATMQLPSLTSSDAT